ncbi:hypothetical protein FIBSPDRAFT_872897 [Athelia psychrophila]|uniref:Uncharacterized protein n=1 Tax=Athelia psychrophila TaxID=1759441 RepID=A0A165Z250_9AGAM|nr:hypothetical protein FIBSPDRAFT_872897 [Fibularhizoctonia sp. CBS 109695]
MLPLPHVYDLLRRSLRVLSLLVLHPLHSLSIVLIGLYDCALAAPFDVPPPSQQPLSPPPSSVTPSSGLHHAPRVASQQSERHAQ